MEYIKTVRLVGLGLLLATGICAQENDTSSFSKWEHSASLNFNFFQDAFYLLPTYEVNKSHLHLGARFNYEDINTFSGWVGYNFMGGDHLAYVITPMVGGLVGRTNAFAAGALIQLDFRRLSFYSEAEMVWSSVIQKPSRKKVGSARNSTMLLTSYLPFSMYVAYRPLRESTV